MKQLKLYLFGPAHIEIDGRTMDLRLRKAVALLAYLAVTRQAHTRDRLATLFWPQSDQQTGRADLRRTLYTLKKAIGDAVLEASTEKIGLHETARIWVDVEVFRRHAAVSAASDGAGTASRTTARLEALTEAANLYSGEFMAGFNLSDCPAFDEWQFFQREDLEQQAMQVYDALVQCYEREGDQRRALSLAQRRLAMDRLHEPTHRRLMHLYFQEGRKTAALRQYRECARILKNELSTAPQSRTRRLYERIKTQQPPDNQPSTAPLPKTRYIKSGSAYIAYQVFGEGPLVLLLVSGFVSHLEHIWREPGLAAFLQRLAGTVRVVLFDRRGVGLSDRVGDPPSLDHTREDMRAVLAAVDAKRAVLFGVSEGGPAIIHFAAAHPEAVHGLILYGTLARGSRSPDYPHALSRQQYDRWLDQLLSSWGGPGGIEAFAPSRAADPALRDWWATLLRTGAGPGSVRMVLDALRDVDVTHLLPHISVPAMVLHRRDDRAVRVGAGRYLAQHIPDSRYVELTGDDHWWWVGDWRPIIEEIESFVRMRG